MSKHLFFPDDISAEYVTLKRQLNQHPLYEALETKDHLRTFMQHHVYAVWDFMSLIKALQRHLAPIRIPWIPPPDIRFSNFINKLVLEEESDYALVENAPASHRSHFQSYCDAMEEVGADTQTVFQFIQTAHTGGIAQALQMNNVPPHARQFVKFTFDTINSQQPHLLAALLAFGRESLLPGLFQVLLGRLESCSGSSTILNAYLDRHIDLDGHQHGPIAIELTIMLCEGSQAKLKEVRVMAERALQARLDFWDGIYQSISNQKPQSSMAI